MEPNITPGDGDTLVTSSETQNEAELQVENDQDAEEKLKPWQEGLLFITNIPEYGGVVAFVIAIIPTFLVLIFYAAVFGEPAENDSDTQTFIWPLLIATPLTWKWLLYLERVAKMSICLPIPIINIPVKWLLGPFMLWLIVMLFVGN